VCEKTGCNRQIDIHQLMVDHATMKAWTVRLKVQIQSLMCMRVLVLVSRLASGRLKRMKQEASKQVATKLAQVIE
jgi:hypothetical protein